MSIATKANDADNNAKPNFTAIKKQFFLRPELINIAFLLIIFIGIYYRTLNLLNFKQMWFDEINIALNILKLDFANILIAINAPIGFLLIQKAALFVFGMADLTFRISPFIFGIASLFAMRILCQKVLSNWSSLAVMIIFALSASLIYFSSEAKQYSQDVFFSIAILLLALRKDQNSRKDNVLSVIFIVVALLFSHPAVLVIGSMIAYRMLADPKNYKTTLLFLITALSILIFLYFRSYRELMDKPHIKSYWQEFFPPEQLAFQFQWFVKNFKKLSWLCLTQVPVWPTISAAIIGLAYWLKHDYKLIILWIGPLILCIVAAYLHCYPFSGERVSLFLVPGMLILIAGSFEAILYLFRKHALARMLVGSIVILTITFQQHNVMARTWYEERNSTNTKNLISRLSTYVHSGDFVIVNNHPSLFFKESFEYYSKIFSIDGAESCHTKNQDCSTKLLSIDISNPQKRLWVLKVAPKWTNSNLYSFKLEKCLGYHVTKIEPLVHVDSKTALFDLGVITSESLPLINKCLFSTDTFKP